MTLQATVPVQKAGRREWLGLAVLGLPTLLISIDVFVMLLALPHLATALHASSTQQLWITDVYGFMLSGFMITMGALGDRIGPRRLLLFGAAAFSAASIAAAYSPTVATLIAARAVQGVAGATLAPSILALISTMFREPRQRGLAIGAWMVCFMGGSAIGPVVGGALLERFWWGSVFLLGVPAMLILLVSGPFLLPTPGPKAAPGGAARLDLASVGLSLGGILSIVFGVKELARSGWHLSAVLAVGCGLLVGYIFVRRQLRLAEPLVDLRLFANRVFTAAFGGMFLGTLLMGAMMLFITERLQLVEQLPPLRAGLWMLPAAGASAVSVVAAPLLARRVRPAYLISGGLVLSVTALAILAALNTDAGPAPVALCFALTNFGAGPLITLATGLILGAVPPERAGSAGALSETSGELGFALGIATLGSLGIAVYRATIAVPAGLPAGAEAAGRDTLAGATAAAGHLPGELGAELLGAAQQAFTNGMQVVAAVSAVLLAGMALLIGVLLRHLEPLKEEELP
jgi:DHA2 family multidrug resistance protein-like MFS transporter